MIQIIGEGKFASSVSDAVRLLKSTKLVMLARADATCAQSTIADARSAATYLDEWRVYKGSARANLELEDGSLILFRRSETDATILSYIFLDTPFEALAYPKFLSDVLRVGHDTQDARQLYDEYRSNADLRPNVVPLRYDYSPATYRPGAHPASHLHVGFRTTTRIGLRVVPTPLAFAAFVIRQFYPDRWEDMIHRRTGFARFATRARTGCVPTLGQHRHPHDESELHLE